MSKIAIISDSHWGARGDRQALIDNFILFYQNVFFPELTKRKIKTLWHLGDLVDRRKFINFNTLDNMKTHFLDPLEKRKIDCHFILGNHDMYFKNKISPNSFEELLGEYSNIRYYCNVTEVNDILVLPWLCEETQSEINLKLKESKARFCFGHLEIKNFDIGFGRKSETGFEDSSFSKFDVVLSGHYHVKSSRNNITYVGAPYEMTWGDYQTPKGFHIFDTSNGELEFIENPYKMFHKVTYNDENKDFQEVFSEIKNLKLKNAFVKVLIESKTNSFLFDGFLEKLNEQKPTDIQIVEDHYAVSDIDDEYILEQAEDTLTILNNYLNSVDMSVNKNELKTLIKELYDEAAMIRS